MKDEPPAKYLQSKRTRKPYPQGREYLRRFLQGTFAGLEPELYEHVFLPLYANIEKLEQPSYNHVEEAIMEWMIANTAVLKECFGGGNYLTRLFCRAGLPKTVVAKLVGCSKRTVYNRIAKRAEKKAAEKSVFENYMRDNFIVDASNIGRIRDYCARKDVNKKFNSNIPISFLNLRARKELLKDIDIVKDVVGNHNIDNLIRFMRRKANVLFETISEQLGVPAAYARRVNKLGAMQPAVQPCPSAIMESKPIAAAAAKQRRGAGKGNTAAIINLSYRQEKFAIRKRLVNYASALPHINAFTLPGTEWLFERDLLIHGLSANKPVSIVGIEQDASNYKYSHGNMPAAGDVVYWQGNDTEFFKETGFKDKTFNFVWLDWMSPIMDSRVAAFTSALEKVEGVSIAALTLVAGHETGEYNQMLREGFGEDANGRLHDARKEVFPVFFGSIAEERGFSVKVLESTIYKEKASGVVSPMYLLVMELTKKTDFKRKEE